MSKIKFTKGELKKQRDALKQFKRYLPILQLKKQQLQLEIQRIHAALKLKAREMDDMEGEINEWAGLLKESGDYVARQVRPKELIKRNLNIAGVDIPLLERVDFEDIGYDLFLTPLWIDTAIKKIREYAVLIEQEKVLRSQLRILQHELRLTTQRVNLFEKVKIPECRENVRLIRIYLGDQQTNAVGRSKIAKNKIERLVLEGIAL